MKLTPPPQESLLVFQVAKLKKFESKNFLVGTFAYSNNSIIDQGNVQDIMVKITINVGFVQKTFEYFFIICIQFA